MPDGRVAYLVLGDHARHKMIDLLDSGAAALNVLLDATTCFLQLLDPIYNSFSVRFTDDEFPAPASK